MSESAKQLSAFDRDTIHRLLNEASRYWVVQTFLSSGELPAGIKTWWAYPDGPISFDWGNAPGPKTKYTPLRGKRVRITLELENE